MTNRGFAGLAAAALGVCCGLPLLLAAGSGVTVAGLGLRSWALVLAGALIAGVGAWRWHDRGGGEPEPSAILDVSGVDRSLRRAAFDVLRTGAAPSIDELAGRTAFRHEEVAGALARLAEAGTVELDGSLVVASDGLSSRPTRHRLVLDGVALHTWCAFDAIGIPAALGADGDAQTACPRCGRTVDVQFDRGRPLAEEPAVVWIPEKRCGNVREQFCPQANLFCGRAHLDAWRRDDGDPPGRALSLRETAELGRRVWADVAGVR